MPTIDIFIISIIILAFLVFGIVLAWGDRQTREIARASRERALRGAAAAPLSGLGGAEAAQPIAREAGQRSERDLVT
jgi:hypothetical protein